MCIYARFNQVPLPIEIHQHGHPDTLLTAPVPWHLLLCERSPTQLKDPFFSDFVGLLVLHPARTPPCNEHVESGHPVISQMSLSHEPNLISELMSSRNYRESIIPSGARVGPSTVQYSMYLYNMFLLSMDITTLELPTGDETFNTYHCCENEGAFKILNL